MKLEQSDAELFYQLWFPLLDFVNRKHHVCPETETIGQRKGIDARNAKKTLGCLLLYAARFDAYFSCTTASSNLDLPPVNLRFSSLYCKKICSKLHLPPFRNTPL